MLYKIGEIANMLGVSIETIRFYERHGLISPVRDEKNKYRMYHPVDLNLIRRLRTYTAYGFSVEEAVALMSGNNLEDMAQSLLPKMDELAQKIEYSKMLLNCMRERQAHLNRVSCMVGECTIEKSPASYGFIFRSDYHFKSEPELTRLVQRFMEHRGFVDSTLIYPLSYWLEDEKRKEQGFCVSENYAGFLQLTEHPQIIYYPSRKSVYTIAEIPYEREERGTGAAFAYVKEYIRAKKLRPLDANFGRVLHTGKKKGSYVHYCEIWVPVE